MSNKNFEHPAGDIGQLILFVLFIFIWVADSFFLRKTTFPAGLVPFVIRGTAAVFLVMTALFLVKSGHRVIDHGKPPDRLTACGERCKRSLSVYRENKKLWPFN
ncbi:MAG: hypothetical protein ACOC57_03755 [Acidobacteriota bacterium]